MTDVIEALALRARKILQLQKESGTQIDRESIAKLVALDGPIFSLATGQTIGPKEIEAATRVLWTIFVTEQGPALVLQDKENLRV